MPPGPSLLPGCLVGWFEDDGSFECALVVSFYQDGIVPHYQVTVIRRVRVQQIKLYVADRGTRWRVLHAA